MVLAGQVASCKFGRGREGESGGGWWWLGESGVWWWVRCLGEGLCVGQVIRGGGGCPSKWLAHKGKDRTCSLHSQNGTAQSQHSCPSRADLRCKHEMRAHEAHSCTTAEMPPTPAPPRIKDPLLRPTLFSSPQMRPDHPLHPCTPPPPPSREQGQVLGRAAGRLRSAVPPVSLGVLHTCPAPGAGRAGCCAGRRLRVRGCCERWGGAGGDVHAGHWGHRLWVSRWLGANTGQGWAGRRAVDSWYYWCLRAAGLGAFWWWCMAGVVSGACALTRRLCNILSRHRCLKIIATSFRQSAAGDSIG